MPTGTVPLAQRLVPGHTLLVAALLATLLAGMLSPLSLLPHARAAAQEANPTFVYQTIFNGAQFDSGRDEVVDGAGNAYIVARAYDTNNDVMVVKLSPSGAVLFVTYLRGSQTDYGTGLALDGQGGLLVSGWTDSPDFPVVNAAQPVKDSRRSAFLARLSTENGAVIYSSFFGANGADEFHDLVVNDAGEIYLVGKTDSTDFPTLNPLQANLNLTNCFCDDAFIVRLSADARTILYSTYLGGRFDDQADSVGLDAAGNIYVAGITGSDDFPTANPIQAAPSGGGEVWAARISASGTHLDYSTYLGGAGTEYMARIAVDPAGYATLAGTTNSLHFPTTPAAFQPVFGGGTCGAAGFGQRACYDAFITRLAPDGSSLVYSTYLGGGNDDEAHGVVMDSAGNAYVVGDTLSTDVPPIAAIFVYGLDATGSQLRYSVTVWSATYNDGHGIALGPGGDVYFTGAQNAPADLYAARLTEGGGPPPTATPLPTSTPVPPPPTTLHVGDLDGSASGSRNWQVRVTVLVHDAGHSPVANVTVSGSWSKGYSGSDQCVTAADGTCTLMTGNIRRTVPSVTFSVKKLTKSGFTYTPAANHDPDGDSNGTSIVVSRP
jgi:Beta-propeller repeat